LIALACAIAARKINGIEPIWNNHIQNRFKHSFNEISGAFDLLYTFYNNTYKNIKQRSKIMPIRKKTRDSSSRNDHPILKINSLGSIIKIDKENDSSKINMKHSESVRACNLPSIQAVQSKLALFSGGNETTKNAESFINKNFSTKSSSNCEVLDRNFPVQKCNNIQFTTDNYNLRSEELVNLKIGRHRIKSHNKNAQNSKNSLQNDSTRLEPVKIIKKYGQSYHSIQNLSKMNPNKTSCNFKNLGARLASINLTDVVTNSNSDNVPLLSRRSVDENQKLRFFKFIRTSLNNSKRSRQSQETEVSQKT
jgi:hypothetical protein